jgi:hypothetical protein
MIKYSDYILNEQIEYIFSDILENMKWISDNEVEWIINNNNLPKKYINLIINIFDKIKKLKNVNNYNDLLKKIIDKIDIIITNNKYKNNIIILIIIIFLSSSFITKDEIKYNPPANKEIINKVLKLKNIDTITNIPYHGKQINKTDISNKTNISNKTDISNKTLKDFLKKLSFKESSNNWKSIKYIKRGKRKIPRYIGKYQFGDLAFKDIKSNIRVKDFIKNPDIWPENQQDKDILKLLNNNKHYLRKRGKFKGYLHYINKKIKNILITESGILAASHLVGNKNVRKFLTSNGKIDKTDGNGTKCSYYMKEFSNYDINN